MSQHTNETNSPSSLTQQVEQVDLRIDLNGLALKNPMMTASGTCGYAYEYDDFLDISRLGAWVTKSITAEVRKGNEAYRIAETRAGMLNAIGLANIGLDAFLADKMPQLVKMRETASNHPADQSGSLGPIGPRIIVNVAGHSTEDYVKTSATIAEELCVDAIELNVSCPNVHDGLTFGTNPALLKTLIKEVRQSMRQDCKLIVKLSPNVEDITLTAQAAVDGGADILSMVNTFTGMAIDIYKRKPRLANGTGGLSGPAIKPLAIRMVSQVYKQVSKPSGVPIIGMGGIQSWEDAAEFLIAGASGLAVGTALFVNPATPALIMDGLRTYLAQQGCVSVNDIIGTLEAN